MRITPKNGHNRKVAVIGLGYVGLPVAVALGKFGRVIGFDVNKQRIGELREGVDRTYEVAIKDLLATDVKYTFDSKDIAKCDFYIVAVPTPVDDHKKPDLTPLIEASRLAASVLSKGDIVVYESTVYPGTTEEVCIPILESEGLVYNKDFFVGYSPERINPGDKRRTLSKITKLLSASNEDALDVVEAVYNTIVKVGTFRCSSIRVAEAAKVIENTQRDLNIALMNELALLFDKLQIDTLEVLRAACTKWNFLDFKPGLVGGHCIGVDPYYLTYKARAVGYNPELILAGRRINDSMGRFVASKAIKLMMARNLASAAFHIYGLTFKANCPDLRNSKVVDIIKELKEYGVIVEGMDPYVDSLSMKRVFGIEPIEPQDMAIAIVAVDHKQFKQKGFFDEYDVIIDVKGCVEPKSGQYVWRL